MTLGGLLVATTAVMVGQTHSDAVAARGGSLAGGAPDVIVGSLHNVERYGQYQESRHTRWERLPAIKATHSLIGSKAQMHTPRSLKTPTGTLLDNGCSRIEHIGRSFLSALLRVQYTLCGSCSNPSGGGCDDQLGYNCSDPYDSYFNGQQNNLGPHKNVNASNGFPVPIQRTLVQGTIGRRLQIVTADVAPARTPIRSTAEVCTSTRRTPQHARGSTTLRTVLSPSVEVGTTATT